MVPTCGLTKKTKEQIVNFASVTNKLETVEYVEEFSQPCSAENLAIAVFLKNSQDKVIHGGLTRSCNFLVKMNLQNNLIGGTISLEICLFNCTEILCTRTECHIPQQIGGISNLLESVMYNNRLTGNHLFGSIPHALCVGNSLAILSLGNNMPECPIPCSLSKFDISTEPNVEKLMYLSFLLVAANNHKQPLFVYDNDERDGVFIKKVHIAYMGDKSYSEPDLNMDSCHVLLSKFLENKEGKLQSNLYMYANGLSGFVIVLSQSQVELISNSPRVFCEVFDILFSMHMIGVWNFLVNSKNNIAELEESAIKENGMFQMLNKYYGDLLQKYFENLCAGIKLCGFVIYGFVIHGLVKWNAALLGSIRVVLTEVIWQLSSDLMNCFMMPEVETFISLFIDFYNDNKVFNSYTFLQQHVYLPSPVFNKVLVEQFCELEKLLEVVRAISDYLGIGGGATWPSKRKIIQCKSESVVFGCSFALTRFVMDKQGKELIAVVAIGNNFYIFSRVDLKDDYFVWVELNHRNMLYDKVEFWFGCILKTIAPIGTWDNKGSYAQAAIMEEPTLVHLLHYYSDRVYKIHGLTVELDGPHKVQILHESIVVGLKILWNFTLLMFTWTP